MSNSGAAPDYTRTPESLRVELMGGIYSRVARETGTTRGHVRRVVRGERRSPLIQAAFRREIARIERAVSRLERKRKTGLGREAA